MRPQMFAIVPVHDDTLVFSWGIDTGEEAFTFRRDPVTHRTLFSVHDNADRAVALASRMLREVGDVKLLRYPISDPLDEDEEDDESRERPSVDVDGHAVGYVNAGSDEIGFPW